MPGPGRASSDPRHTEPAGGRPERLTESRTGTERGRSRRQQFRPAPPRNGRQSTRGFHCSPNSQEGARRRRRRITARGAATARLSGSCQAPTSPRRRGATAVKLPERRPFESPSGRTSGARRCARGKTGPRPHLNGQRSRYRRGGGKPVSKLTAAAPTATNSKMRSTPRRPDVRPMRDNERAHSGVRERAARRATPGCAAQAASLAVVPAHVVDT